VSYGFEETNQAFIDANVRLRTLTNFNAILDAAHDLALYENDEIAIIQNWFRDPFNWGKDIVSNE